MTSAPSGPSSSTPDEGDEMGKLVVTEFVSLDGVARAAARSSAWS